MKKWIFLIVLTLFPMFANADVDVIPAKDELYQVNTMQDIEKDLSKRLILGVLGKDALIYFLPSDANPELADQIKGLSTDELDKLSRPFNSSIISGTLILISSFFLVALTTFIFYIIWVYVESLFRTQDSGEFLGDRWSKAFTPLKIIIGFTLIFPMFGQSHSPFNKLSDTGNGWNVGAFSLSQVAVLMSVGAANQSANMIYGEFVRAMPKHYPMIKMPNVTSKAVFMSDVIDFMMCVKSSAQQQISVTFRRHSGAESSIYKMNARAGKCEIYGQIGFDDATVNDLKTNNNLVKMIGNVDYEGMQRTAIQTAANNLFRTASEIADAIIVSDNSINLIKSDLEITPSTWRNACSNIASYAKEDLTDEGLITFGYYAANCLSKNFIEDLSKASASVAYIYSEQNYLKGNNLELCAASGDPDSNGDKPLTYAKVDEDEFVFGTHFKMISDCVRQVCTGSNIYECASAINFAKELEEKDKMARMGWITGGANTYKLFSGRDNINARTVINKSSFSTDYLDNSSAFIDLDDSTVPTIDSFTVSINGVSPSSYDYSDFSNFVETKSLKYDQTIIDNGRDSSILPNVDGWFGISKLKTCIENPMKVTGGHLCGNVTEEVHIFGSKLIALGIQVKTISLMVNSYQGKAQKDVGTVSKVAVSTIKKGVKVLDKAGPAAITAFLLSPTLISNDSFSELDSEVWGQYPEIISFVVASVGSSIGGDSNPTSGAVSKLIDILTALLLVLGILFGFVMPLLPFTLWMIAIAGWVVALFEALVLAPIWGVVLIAPSKDHTADAARKSTIIIVSLLLKAPLLITGLIVAWLLNNILLSEILAFSDVSQALALQPAEFIKGLIDQFILLVVYFVMLYGIYNIIFSLIESFNDVAIDVLFGGKGISPFAQKQRGENWRSSVSAATSAISKQ